MLLAIHSVALVLAGCVSAGPSERWSAMTTPTLDQSDTGGGADTGTDSGGGSDTGGAESGADTGCTTFDTSASWTGSVPDPAPGCRLSEFDTTWAWNGDHYSEAKSEDADGRVQWAAWYIGYAWLYYALTYNADGNVSTWAESDGGSVRYREVWNYDMDQRITSVDFYYGDDDTPAASLPYTYNAQGQLVSGGREYWNFQVGGPCTYIYDADGNVVSVQLVSGAEGETGSFVETWTYDVAGRLVADEYQSSGSHWLRSYTYDTDGNMLSDLDENDDGYTWSYDLDGRLLVEEEVNGGVASDTWTYNYDPDGVLRTVDESDSVYGHWSIGWYTYDADGLLQSVLECSICGYCWESTVYVWVDEC